MIDKRKLSIYSGLISFSSLLIYSLLSNLSISLLFIYHPILVLVGLFTVTEGIIGIQNNGSNNLTAEKKLDYHGIYQGVGYTALTIAFTVIYYNKILNGKEHFQTLHGQLGALSYTYLSIQALMGSMAAYAPGLFGGVARARGMYKYHRISGYFLFFLLWITALSGVLTPFVISLLPSSQLAWVYWLSALLVVFCGVFNFNNKKSKRKI